MLEKVTQGLRDGGHTYEVIDLHAVGFDPVFRRRDYNQFMHPTLPDELVELPDFKAALVERAAGRFGARVPLLTQQKDLLITPTFFTREEYEKGWQQAVDAILCDWSLKMAGVKETEHVYFYAVCAVDQQTRLGYLDLAYQVGKDFAHSEAADGVAAGAMG